MRVRASKCDGCGQPAIAAYGGTPICPDCAAEGYGDAEEPEKPDNRALWNRKTFYIRELDDDEAGGRTWKYTKIPPATVREIVQAAIADKENNDG